GARGEGIAEGRVVACDVPPTRIRRVTAARDRLRLDHMFAVVADGRNLPLRDGSGDRVLVDAPCTGLGVLRRRAELRWRIRAEEVPRLVELQRELLRAAARAVRPDGGVGSPACPLPGAPPAPAAAPPP